MKPIPEGTTATHALTVSEAMTVDFEQAEPELGKLHPVYATYWLTKHMELVSRKIILPFLEPFEEGVGFEVSIKHLASALPGMEVRLEARYLRTEKNRVYASCEAFNELGDRVGEGTTTQVVLERKRLEAGFERLQERWDVAKTSQKSR